MGHSRKRLQLPLTNGLPGFQAAVFDLHVTQKSPLGLVAVTTGNELTAVSAADLIHPSSQAQNESPVQSFASVFSCGHNVMENE